MKWLWALMVAVVLLWVVIIVLAVGGYTVGARSRGGILTVTFGEERSDRFRVVAREYDPTVTLFEHIATGQCFLAYHNGGLVSVDKALCTDQPER